MVHPGPALDQAAHLVLTRADELNGNLYEILAPAAAALETKHPLAATALRRVLIDFALEQNRVSATSMRPVICTSARALPAGLRISAGSSLMVSTCDASRITMAAKAHSPAVQL